MRIIQTGTLLQADFFQQKPTSAPVGEKALPHTLLVRNPAQSDEEVFRDFLEKKLGKTGITEKGKLWFRFGKGWTFCRFERRDDLLTCYRQIFPGNKSM